MLTQNQSASYAKFLLNKADGRFYFAVYGNRLEKAHRDISKLTRKIIIDKNGHKKTVYVRLGAEKKDGKVKKYKIAETEHERGLTDRELKRECFLYARENFQGKIFKNTDTGRDILVSRDGLNKWSYATKSREQSISIKKLDTILEKCKKTGSDTDRKNRHSVDSFTYYTHEMEINKKPYKITLLTKETNQTHSKYYYHYLEDIKIEPDSGSSKSLVK